MSICLCYGTYSDGCWLFERRVLCSYKQYSLQVSSKDQTFSGLGNSADLDLSLVLRAPDGDHENESKNTKQGEGYTKSVRAATSTQDTETKVTKSVAQNKLKRKVISSDLEMAV